MTKRYLNKSAKNLFWLFLLGIPYLLWMYSIGIELNKKLPKNKIMNKVLLNLLVGYPFIYLICAWVLLFSGKMNIDLIIPFHFGAIFCMFLLLILITITIIRFEKAEKIKQSSSIGVFFGLWYFIIGVWYLQPKFNEYIKRVK